MFRRTVLLAAVSLAVLSPAVPADAAVHHGARAHLKTVAKAPVAKPVVAAVAPCTGVTPGVPSLATSGAVQDVSVAFDPFKGGLISVYGVLDCIPAGWEVRSMNALPGNPTYAVRVTDQMWVNFTYDAAGRSTPHALASWVRL